jgi:hypothetical protein
MRVLSLIIVLLLFVGCGSTKNTDENRPLYEILIQKNSGGAKFQFYEIISQEDEFVMIKNDPELKRKIKPNAILSSNFLLLSMGEKETSGYSITVEKVVETEKSVIVTIKESAPKPNETVTMAITNPYCVVRINSKKEIIIQ